MTNNVNIEPNIKDVAAQEITARETKRKESWVVISAKAQTILDFLRKCKPYEADSIRVMIGYALGTGDVENGTDTVRNFVRNLYSRLDSSHQ